MWFLGASPILREAQKEKIKKKWRRRKSRNKEQRKKQYAPISKHQPWTIHTQNRGGGGWIRDGIIDFLVFPKIPLRTSLPPAFGGGDFWIADFSKLTGIVSLPYIFWTAGAVREFLLLMKISDSNDVEIITLWSSLRDSMVQQGTRPFAN